MSHSLLSKFPHFSLGILLDTGSYSLYLFQGSVYGLGVDVPVGVGHSGNVGVTTGDGVTFGKFPVSVPGPG